MITFKASNQQWHTMQCENTGYCFTIQKDATHKWNVSLVYTHTHIDEDIPLSSVMAKVWHMSHRLIEALYF